MAAHIGLQQLTRPSDCKSDFEIFSHFRAALQKTVKMHHQRQRHYENVIEKLDLHRSHLDQRRRDLGYESEHG